MEKFQFQATRIEGVYIIEPTVFGDERGYFMEAYNERAFEAAGICTKFVQANQARSKKGVLRGLHYQKNYPQAKLLRALSGEIFDVAVDLRPGSASYGEWVGVTLSAENKKQFFVPRGFAHGTLMLSDMAEFTYMCDELYHPEDEGGVRWDDPAIGVAWPQIGCDFILSQKDRSWADMCLR